MTTRTTRSTVTFRRPFNLTGFDGPQPAGTYSVETDEALIEGLSFPAYQRISTVMQLERGLHAIGTLQVAVIDPRELEAALAVDAAHTAAHDEFMTWRAANLPPANGR